MDLRPYARHGIRILWREPAFVLAAGLTLGLGVGAAAAVFALLDSLVFRPLPHVTQPAELVAVSGASNYVAAQQVASTARAFELASYSRSTATLEGGGLIRNARLECVSGGYFQVLETVPSRGRPIGADDERARGLVAMISTPLWLEAFASGEVLGRSVTIQGRVFTIVGIAPAGFRGVEFDPVDVWIPITAAPQLCSFTGSDLLASRTGSWLTSIGRLRDGATLEQARIEAAALSSAVCTERRKNCVKVSSLLAARQRDLARERRLAIALSAAALILLFIGCANVAGLLSIRGMHRRRDYATRLHLGASRTQVLAHVGIESVVIGLVCSAAAMLFATWIGASLRVFFATGLMEEGLDARVLLVIALLSIVSTLASGLLPALSAVRSRLSDLPKGGAAVVVGRGYARGVLVAGQVALAVSLVVGAGLFVRSVSNVKSNLGYDLDRVAVVTVDLSRTGLSAPDIAARFAALRDRATSLPGITSADLSSGAILGVGGAQIVTAIRTADNPMPMNQALATAVSPGYFRTIGTPLLSGRSFTEEDGPGARPVMIVDQTTAASYWPGQFPVGKCAFFMHPKSPCVEVVGIVPTRRANAVSEPMPEIFFPLAQGGTHFPGDAPVPQLLIVRDASSASDAAARLRAAIGPPAAGEPLVDVQPLEHYADVEARNWRLSSTVLTVFSGIATVLVIVGIYATLAFSVSVRSREIGLRIALGAPASKVVRMIGRQSLVMAAAGLAAGLGLALAGGKYVASLLYAVDPTDPVTLASAAAVILTAAVSGTVLPAWRASRIDPIVTLRSE